jgi:hypothetical protein
MSAPDDAPKSALKISLAQGAVIHVAQIGLRSIFPLLKTDLAYGHGTRYAENCEAVQDRGTDLDLRNLPIGVARCEAPTE